MCEAESGDTPLYLEVPVWELAAYQFAAHHRAHRVHRGIYREVLLYSVIEACIRTWQMDLLSDLMQRFQQRGGLVNLSAPTYGSMIKAYGQAGEVLRVQELWKEVQGGA